MTEEPSGNLAAELASGFDQVDALEIPDEKAQGGFSVEDVFEVGLNRAVTVIAEKKERGNRRAAPAAIAVRSVSAPRLPAPQQRIRPWSQNSRSAPRLSATGTSGSG